MNVKHGPRSHATSHPQAFVTHPQHISSRQMSAMLSQLQASYQRVEQSLQRLTDSIASYNPSVHDADELVAADEAVNRDLDRRMRPLQPVPSHHTDVS